MKTTSKILLAVIALFIIASSGTFAKGGGNGRFSVGAELGLPMGTFGDFAKMGFGGSLRYEMPVGDNLGLTGTAGYLTFSAKDNLIIGKITYSMIPIMVGAKYYFTEQQNGFYGAFAIGITMTTAKADIPEIDYTDPFTGAKTVLFPASSVSTSTSNFTFAPGIGYHLDNLDFAVNYNDVTATGGSLAYVGVRVAYVFGSK